MSAPEIGVQRRIAPLNPEIDWSHPLAQGLKFMVVNDTEIITGVRGTLNGTLASTHGPYGRAVISTSGYVSWPSTAGRGANCNGVGACTMAFIAKVPGSDSCRFGQWSEGGNAWTLLIDTTVQVYRAAGGNFSGGTVTRGEWGLYAVSVTTANGTWELYRNGVQIATSSAMTGSPAPDSVNFNYINTSDSTTNGSAGAAAWVWHCDIGKAGHAMLWADPFCMLRR